MNELLCIDDRNPETCFFSFKRIAESLMNDYKLQVGDRFFRIIDCEFYFSSEQHDDCYVHGHQRQKESTGEWYFHGSGLDITVAGNNSYGGILIRGIVEVTSKAQDPFIANPVIGPLNVCPEIFKSFGKVLLTIPLEFGFVNISMERMGALMKKARVFAVPICYLSAHAAQGGRQDQKVSYNRSKRNCGT